MNDLVEPLFHVIGPDRREYGPVPAAELNRWWRDRRVASTSPTRRADEPTWRIFADFPELSRTPPPPIPRPPPIPSMTPQEAELTIPSHLIASILLTLVGCLPLGLVAIYFSGQVAARIRQGDIDGAWRASRRARVWCWVAFLTGFPAWVLLVVGVSKWLGLS